VLPDKYNSFHLAVLEPKLYVSLADGINDPPIVPEPDTNDPIDVDVADMFVAFTLVKAIPDAVIAVAFIFVA
jgi:hypothetical protein